MMKKTISIVLVMLFFMVLLEGISGIIINLYNSIYAYRHFGAAEASSTETQYDETLGWVNKPNIKIANMFGDGRPLTLNSQGFRNPSTIPPKAATGLTRIVMIGDSFVFGSENGDSNTLAANLERLSNFECINMGVPGYGVDQAYLHYKKNGLSLTPDLLVFCVLPTDFDRASRTRYRTGYSKPYIRIKGGQLKVTNVPVPLPLTTQDSLFTKQDATLWYLKNMATYQLLRKSLKAIGVNVEPEIRGIDYGLHIMPYILSDLKQSHRMMNTRIVVVSLPMHEDYIQGTLTEKAKSFISKLAIICKEAGVEHVDLGNVFESLTDTKLQEFFHKDWHYNEHGARMISTELSSRLQPFCQTTNSSAAISHGPDEP